MSDADLVDLLYQSVGILPHQLRGQPEVARIEIHANRVLGVHLVPGLQVDAKEQKDGIEAAIVVTRGSIISRPIYVCFGIMPEDGRQLIVLRVEVEPEAKAAVLAHCTFPNARRIRHEMQAVLNIGRNAEYAYLERHVHGPAGGVLVLPRSRVHVDQGARYRTEFELIRGRVGEMDIQVEVTGEASSVTEVAARIYGAGDDRIAINETAQLVGQYAHGALTTSIALRDSARAVVHNTLRASAAHARGHVDCKEIVQDQAVAEAVPVVAVSHPKAHVTHEAAIGSVDSKQLETLMSRGLTEDEAVDLIIRGLLGESRFEPETPVTLA
jgi:Fe-S cluster assembly scaffold protein SufB